MYKPYFIEKIFVSLTRLKKRALENALDETGLLAIDEAIQNIGYNGEPKKYLEMRDELLKISKNLRNLNSCDVVRDMYTNYLVDTYNKRHKKE
ncbi:MAG: hypothetical protein Q7S33_01860 [Nanoarchaeota archaeon]|nr:hypothetical protein [Nanoarchaeota archaeon]